MIVHNIFSLSFAKAGILLLMILALLPIAHAQQIPDGTDSAMRLHRPDNQAKQKESISGGTCAIQTGAFPVGFNAYVVPDGDHPSYPRFCSPVPAGPLNLVIDILSPDIREMPLMVKLMKIDDQEEREIVSVPAIAYTSGNIPLAVDLEPLSKYNVLLIGDDGGGNSINLVTIPLEVRRAGDFVNTGYGGPDLSLLFLVAALMGIAGGILHFWRPKPAARRP